MNMPNIQRYAHEVMKFSRERVDDEVVENVHSYIKLSLRMLEIFS
jgi:hypothetical protein